MTLCCDNGSTWQLSPLRMCNLWQTSTPLPIVFIMWLLARCIFSFRNSLSHSLQVLAYLRFASLNPNLLNYDPNCTSVILTSSRFSAVAENETVANVLQPAWGLLLGRGAAMLKKSTETYIMYEFVNKLFLINDVNRCGMQCVSLEQTCL